MKKIGLVIVISVLTFTSCTSSYLFKPIVTVDTQETMFANGYEFLLSHGEHSGVGMFVEKTKKGELRMHAEIFNTSTDKYFDFNPEDITVTYLRNGTEVNIKVYSPRDYMKKLERSQNIQIAVAAMDYAVNNTSTDGVGSQLANERNYTRNSLLVANRLYPEDEVEGDVMTKTYRMTGERFMVTMPIASDIHEFVFKIPK